MMKNAAAVIALAALLLAACVAQAEMTKSGQVPDTILIDNSKTFVTLTKPLVLFNHAKHSGDYRVRCDRCHHVYKDKRNTWQEGDKVGACAQCHRSSAGNEDSGMLGLMNAYHQKCRDCHKDGKKGPTNCFDCHTQKGKEPVKKLW